MSTVAVASWLLRFYKPDDHNSDAVELQPFPKDATLPHATPEELSQDVIENRAFFIADVPRDSLFWMQIRGKVFKNCQIYGPAVLALEGMCSLKHISLGIQHHIPIENALYTCPSGIPRWGAIQLQACELEDCKLIGIGIAGSDEEIENLRKLINRDSDPRTPPPQH